VESNPGCNLQSEHACHLAGSASPECEQLLRAILESSTAVISVKDVNGRYLLVNRLFETLFQATRAQVVGRTDYDFFPTEVADKFWANHLRVLAAQTPLEFEEVVGAWRRTQAGGVYLVDPAATARQMTVVLHIHFSANPSLGSIDEKVGLSVLMRP